MNSSGKHAYSTIKTSLGDLPIIFEPVYLTEDEDDARIKRLSKQIIACVERAKQERKKSQSRLPSGTDCFSKNYDEIFGL